MGFEDSSYRWIRHPDYLNVVLSLFTATWGIDKQVGDIRTTHFAAKRFPFQWFKMVHGRCRSDGTLHVEFKTLMLCIPSLSSLRRVVLQQYQPAIR